MAAAAGRGGRRAGFATWNVDLIIGGAGESDADWDAHPRRGAGPGRPPPHISAYALTVEPGTPLAADPARPPDDDVQAGRYEQADRVLTPAGYRWEEVSNWALPGHELPPQPAVLAPGRLPGHRLGRPLPPGRAALVERPHPRPLRGRGRGPLARARPARRWAPASGGFEGLALALRTPAGVPADALPDLPDLDGPGRAVGGAGPC